MEEAGPPEAPVEDRRVLGLPLGEAGLSSRVTLSWFGRVLGPPRGKLARHRRRAPEFVGSGKEGTRAGPPLGKLVPYGSGVLGPRGEAALFIEGEIGHGDPLSLSRGGSWSPGGLVKTGACWASRWGKLACLHG